MVLCVSGSMEQQRRQTEREFDILETIKQVSLDNKSMLQQLLIAIQSGASGTVVKPGRMPAGFHFPLNSVEEVQQLDSLLGRDREAKRDMVNAFTIS